MNASSGMAFAEVERKKKKPRVIVSRRGLLDSEVRLLGFVIMLIELVGCRRRSIFFNGEITWERITFRATLMKRYGERVNAYLLIRCWNE